MSGPATRGAGVARLIVSVEDLDRAVRFYREVLGLRLQPGAGELATLRTEDGLTVMLHQRPTTASTAAVSIGFLVDDVDATTTLAQGAGASVIDPPADQPWGERMSVLTDPDGHVICLSGR